MKITYDPLRDVLNILLSSSPTDSSTTVPTGIVLDYDQDGNVVKLEISNASKRVERPFCIDYSVLIPHQDLKSTETQSNLTLEQRRAFLKLPQSERRRILGQQAADMENHYQQNTEWKEFLAGDIIDY
ncbi:DUF2283 domain-containing protein [Crocosphaera sp. XPORK-15E]|nr:DUF2283 domain-containing protein [Crocosphaera sp. XPORK-15E]